jgi:outer membrane protein OmpA-like peptidoglycan-associated protein
MAAPGNPWHPAKLAAFTVIAVVLAAALAFLYYKTDIGAFRKQVQIASYLRELKDIDTRWESELVRLRTESAPSPAGAEHLAHSLQRALRGIEEEAAVSRVVTYSFPELKRALQDKAELMEPAGTWGVLVQGYADAQGPAGYNRLLAERRALAVKQFLVELGVPELSIKVVTIGQEGALCDEPSAECQQLNRRVHLEIRRLPRSAAEPLRPALLVGDTLDTLAGRSSEP